MEEAALGGSFLMLYLLLAIAASALVSIFMRLSSDRVHQNVGMLSVNYATCLALAAVYAALGGGLFPETFGLAGAAGMGAVNGFLYLASFILLQVNVRQNGVVLSATFMKLGLLVPMATSVIAFGEQPEALQIAGFLLALTAIVLINAGKGSVRSGVSLLLLLIGGGSADVMAKIFEELGNTALGDQFLTFTFLFALLLCLALMVYKKQRPGKAEIFWGFLIGIPNFFSAKFLLRALESISAVIVYPTYSVATLLIITLAGVLFFREKLRRRQWVALGIILAALVMLNL